MTEPLRDVTALAEFLGKPVSRVYDNHPKDGVLPRPTPVTFAGRHRMRPYGSGPMGACDGGPAPRRRDGRFARSPLPHR
ncbi:hypothetical protein [Streptomyces mangrovi]|uniref:hypothetical protein n=1 Tax=Streptomyces mangrovi TaxID=1206892 RepID=UPI00399CE309